VISFLPYPQSNYTWGDDMGAFELLDVATGSTSYVSPSGAPLGVHEMVSLANGDFLVFAVPILTKVDLQGLGQFGANSNMIDCVIQEVTPEGYPVWEWSATDHFDPVRDSIGPMLDVVDGVDVADVYHCNSIDVAPNGDLLVSARNMNSVFLVSRQTGAVVWKMGGAPYTKDNAVYLAVRDDPQTSFVGQHDARLLPEAGVSMFDDQTGGHGPARAVVYSYDLDAGSASLTWQYQGTTNVAGMGSFRVLPDGSRVIGWGYGAGDTRAFTEVDEAGNALLDFYFLDGTRSYRAIKIPTTAFTLALLRQAAGTR
jgi:hypothetical protein